MTSRRLVRILGCAAALAIAGCAGGGPLAVPDGSAMCATVLPGNAEPYWFGVPVSNVAGRPITLKAVHLGEQDHMLVDEAFAVPPIQLRDGTTLGVGVIHDPAAETPDMWAGRQAVTGYVIAPGATVDLVFGLTRDGAETGEARSQDVTYRVDGEHQDRYATSRLELTLTDDGC